MKKTNNAKLIIETPTEVLDKVERECFTQSCQEMLDLLTLSSNAWRKLLEENLKDVNQGNYLLTGTRLVQIVDSLKDYVGHLENVWGIANYAQKETLVAIVNSKK